MTEFSTQLSQVNDHIARRIEAGSIFADRKIEVLTERKGDIVSTIAKSLSRLGLSIIVLTPDATISPAATNSTAVRIRPRIIVEVAENFTINNGITGTKLPALDAVAAILPLLHKKPNGLQPEGQLRHPGLYELTLDPQPYRLVPHDLLTIYHITLTTDITLQPTTTN